MKRLLILLAAVAPTFAEDNFDAQLNRAQRTFERQANTALLPEYERYINELASLERALVSGEDFAEAAAVQSERLKIRDLIASSKTPLPTRRRPLKFGIKDAASSGNTLTWTPNAPIAPGGYKISLEPDAEEAVISEGFHTAKPGQTLRITTGETISVTLPPGAAVTLLTLTPGG